MSQPIYLSRTPNSRPRVRSSVMYYCEHPSYVEDGAMVFADVAAFQAYAREQFGVTALLVKSFGGNYRELFGETVLVEASPELHDYHTGDFIRAATADEFLRSLNADDGGVGAFDLDGRDVYVTDF